MTKPTGPNKMSKKILIVDDEKPIARALQLKLNHVNFETKIANDGAEALKDLESEPFDLVLLDLIMPTMDGFTVLSEMKNRKINVPVIACTNLGQEEDVKRAREFGVKEYFVKSNTPLQQIIDQIKKVLNI